ncbi:MAG: carboxypeptidase regulatory-like domain-containing protein [Pedobacter sp.]|nr:MAG: carboxypeptidase regulatory-like domain-containing protein [Pedobacter sp.]
MWNYVAAGKDPEIIHRAESALEITGRITTLSGKPLTGAKVILLSTTQDLPLLLDTVSDAKGNFVFDRLDIPDSASFSVQAKGLKNSKDVVIEINERAGVSRKAYMGRTTDLSSYLETTKEQFQVLVSQNMLDKRILIKEVQIKAPKPIKVVNVIGSANAMGTADYVVPKKIIDYAPDMVNIMRMVPGRTAFTKLKDLRFIINGNEIPQDMNVDVVGTINPKDIEGIEVLSSKYNTSVYGGGIIVHLTLKRGKDRPIDPMPFKRISSRGYTIVKEFYAPDYDNPNINKNMADLRSTVFWKPNIITDANGKGSSGYFNAATPGTYRVTVEGMDQFGNIGRKVFTYKVE